MLLLSQHKFYILILSQFAQKGNLCVLFYFYIYFYFTHLPHRHTMMRMMSRSPMLIQPVSQPFGHSHLPCSKNKQFRMHFIAGTDRQVWWRGNIFEDYTRYVGVVLSSSLHHLWVVGALGYPHCFVSCRRCGCCCCNAFMFYSS